jgi:hypothetical protein
MGIARFTARIYTYSAPWPEPAGPLTQEQGETLTLEWDRQSGVQEQTSLVTSFTWVLHKVFGDPSSPLVTWTLWDDRGTVTQDGYHFDFVAMVGDPTDWAARHAGRRAPPGARPYRIGGDPRRRGHGLADCLR